MADIPESKPTSRGQLRRVCDSSIVLRGEPEFVLDVPAAGGLSKGQLRRVCDSSLVLSGEPEALDPVLLLTLRLASDVDPATAGIQTSALVDSANQLVLSPGSGFEGALEIIDYGKESRDRQLSGELGIFQRA